MFNNERGSVLSIAVIIIVILSFAVTTTTVYTYSVATRSNAVVQTADEDLFARMIINQVIYEIREFVYGSGVAVFDAWENFDLAEIERIETKYNAIINSYYLANFGDEPIRKVLTITVDYEDIGSISPTRKYKISYIKDNNIAIFRELLIALSQDDEGNIEDSFENPDDLIDYLGENYFSEDQVFACEENCGDNFIEHIASSPTSGTLEDDIYVDGNLDLIFASNAGYEFNLNGHILYIKGDLVLDNLHNFDGPGLIVVTGNLYISGSHRTFVDDISILVRGYTEIDFSESTGGGNKRLESQDNLSFFHIVSGITTPKRLYDVLTEGSSYWVYCFDDINNPTSCTSITPDDGQYQYIGNDPYFPGMAFFLEEYANLFEGSSGGFGDVFDDATGPFKEE